MKKDRNVGGWFGLIMLIVLGGLLVAPFVEHTELGVMLAGEMAEGAVELVVKLIGAAVMVGLLYLFIKHALVVGGAIEKRNREFMKSRRRP